MNIIRAGNRWTLKYGYTEVEILNNYEAKHYFYLCKQRLMNEYFVLYNIRTTLDDWKPEYFSKVNGMVLVDADIMNIMHQFVLYPLLSTKQLFGSSV